MEDHGNTVAVYNRTESKMNDFFGAHTYERLDHPRGEFFHTDWTGAGGTISSSTYNA